jgi:hypothetical protein
MSAYLKSTLRIVVLAALVFGVITLQPAKASTSSCETDCNDQYSICLSSTCAQYKQFIFDLTAYAECRALCQDQLWTCLACCSDPTVCV